jgi:dolichol-phosphate mannosyltransferase
MLRLAANGLVSFSDAPLRLALWAGTIICAAASIYAISVAILWITKADLTRGWSSLILLITFLGGANMLLTGVLGVYVGRIHAEVKRRPLYVVERAVGFESSAETRPEDARRPLSA